MFATLRALAFVGVLFAPALLQGGCASSRPELPPQAKTGLQDISNSLADGKMNLQATMKALAALDVPKVDVGMASKNYAAALAKLDASITRTRAGMKAAEKPDEFFQSWQNDLNSITNTQLRETGEKRYEEARADLRKLNTKIDNLRDAFTPVHKDLEDIGTYLKNDPTNSGLEACKPIIRRVLSKSDTVMSKVDDVQKGIKDMLE